VPARELLAHRLGEEAGPGRRAQHDGGGAVEQVGRVVGRVDVALQVLVGTAHLLEGDAKDAVIRLLRVPAQLAWLANNPFYAKRFAFCVGQRCRSGTIRDVARELRLDWKTVKELFLECRRCDRSFVQTTQ
jgi:hypothetical protein